MRSISCSAKADQVSETHVVNHLIEICVVTDLKESARGAQRRFR